MAHLPLLCEVYVASAQPDLADSAGLQIAGTWHSSPDKASVNLQTLSSCQAPQQPLVVLSKLWLKSAGYLADHAPSPSLATPGQATEHHEWSSPAALSSAQTAVDRQRQSTIALLTSSLHSSEVQFYKRCCRWRETLIFRVMLDQHCYLLSVRQLKMNRRRLTLACMPKHMNKTTGKKGRRQ